MESRQRGPVPMPGVNAAHADKVFVAPSRAGPQQFVQGSHLFVAGQTVTHRCHRVVKCGRWEDQTHAVASSCCVAFSTHLRREWRTRWSIL